MIAATRTRTPSLGLLTGLLAIICLAFGATPAMAMQEINMFDATVFDDAGSPVTNAGRHPNTASVKFMAEPYYPTERPTYPWTREHINDVIVELPPGFVGNPLATTNCTIAGFVNSILGESCPAESQVGYAALYPGGQDETIGAGFGSPVGGIPVGVANLGPASGTPAVLGINFIGVIIYSSASVRSGDDYGVTISTENIPVAANLHGVSYNVWGNPQDPVHDSERGFYCLFAGFECLPSTAPNVPFLSMPTSCSGAPPVTKLAMDSWEHPGEFAEASALAHDNTAPVPNPTATDACNALEFPPTLEARPTTTAGDSPSGLDVDLHIPQNEDPHGTATAHLKDSRVTLPEGLVVNPSSANGLGTCSLSEIGFIGGSGNEEQNVDLTGIGPFSLSFDGETTATISGDSPDTVVQAALEALPNIAPGDVEVKGPRNGPYTIEFTGALGGQDVPLMSAEGLSNKIQRLSVDGEVFSQYKLTYGASTTNGIYAGYPNSTPELNLDNLPAVKAAGGNVTVTGGPGNVGATKPLYVIFDGGTFAGTDQSISATPFGVNSVTITDVQAAGQPLQGNVVTSKESGHLTFTSEPADCPDAARLASAEIETPLLDHVMKGSVYLAEPFANPFDELIGLYITANDVQTGIVVKLPGHVELDPVTGRVTAVFDDNPQVPFEHLRLHFFGGSTAALKTPSVCGDHTTTSVLTPWSAPDSGPPAQTTDTWQITQNCAGSEAGKPNSPSFDAGTVSPIAGAHSAFVVHLRREDGSQNFAALNVSPPPGLLGKLAGTTSCSDAALVLAEAKTGAQEKASPSCPPSSELGNVMAGAGAGPAPYYVPGKAYRTGPYKGAPLSVTIIVPAVAGVFDLGTVVVKTALYVDSKTGRLSAVSDPIHTIIDGIPLGVKTIDITVDRPGFIVNPTSCDPMAVDGQLITTIGQVAPLSSRFQLGECTGLGFKPQLSLNLKGGTTRGKYPALTAVLTPRAGDANISSVSVALPKSEFLEQAHIGTVCTRVQFAADECPAASVYGTATVTTPLLDQPLTGNVYLRSSDNVLPDLVPDLRGPANLPLKVESAGRTDSVNRGIRNTFDYLPDAPFTKLVLQLQGGNKGLLQNSRNICSQVYRATVKYTAHNGKTHTAKPALKNPKCGKAKKRKAAKRAKRRARSAAR